MRGWAEGGEALAVRAGQSYIDVGATDGYFEAVRLLGGLQNGTERPVSRSAQ